MEIPDPIVTIETTYDYSQYKATDCYGVIMVCGEEVWRSTTVSIARWTDYEDEAKDLARAQLVGRMRDLFAEDPRED